MNGHVLLVDDDPDLCRLMAARLGSRGFAVTCKRSGDEARAVLADGEVDVVVTDLAMSGMDGLELCDLVVANRPDIPVVILTAFGSLDAAVGAMRCGAYDFITKPADIDAITATLERAVRRRRVGDEVKLVSPAIAVPRAFAEILTTSPAMRKVLDLLARISDVDAAVLITGESGTGKELVARALHRGGRRRDGPFVAVNCAAIPDALLESELFGHVRGAFTGAATSRAGLFQRAHGGTLFLDEIAELPLALQPKLLRALQDGVVRPVGSDAELRCDVRLVTATNRDLEEAVQGGRFREDLYFRVNVVAAHLPPLRARENDVLFLAQHFIERYAARAGKPMIGLTPEAAERLLAYPWPGNVRQLEHCVERAVLLARFDRIAVDDLPENIRRAGGARRVVGTAGQSESLALEDPQRPQVLPLDEIVRCHILSVLGRVKGNRKLAAELLGVDRKTLYRKLLCYRSQTQRPFDEGHPARGA